MGAGGQYAFGPTENTTVQAISTVRTFQRFKKGDSRRLLCHQAGCLNAAGLLARLLHYRKIEKGVKKKTAGVLMITYQRTASVTILAAQHDDAALSRRT